MAGQRLVRNSLLTVAIYLSIGVIAFTWLAGMSALEALYFCVGGCVFYFCFAFSSATLNLSRLVRIPYL